jgi:hypothetical protein
VRRSWNRRVDWSRVGLTHGLGSQALRPRSESLEKPTNSRYGRWHVAASRIQANDQPDQCKRIAP